MPHTTTTPSASLSLCLLSRGSARAGIRTQTWGKKVMQKPSGVQVGSRLLKQHTHAQNEQELQSTRKASNFNLHVPTAAMRIAALCARVTSEMRFTVTYYSWPKARACTETTSGGRIGGQERRGEKKKGNTDTRHNTVYYGGGGDTRRDTQMGKQQ